MGQHSSKMEVIGENNLLASTIDQQNKLIDKVLHERKFNICSVTEFGNFGPTINIKFPPMKNEYAVKILKQKCIGPEELEWYKLYNENIQSLIHIEFLENTEVFLFYTEDWNYSMNEIIEQKLLQRSQDGLTRALKWLKQIAHGLNYLHKKQLFHLNLITKNILITDNDDAKISNFHWICSRKSFNKKRWALPMQFGPPEIFCAEENYNFEVNPEKYESWSYGILMVNLLTGDRLSRKLFPTPKLWAKYIYPDIYEVLKPKMFNQLVKKSYPNSYNNINLKTLRKTVSHILSFYPTHRPTASEIIFLLNTLGVELQVQDGNIWKKKVEWKKLQENLFHIEDNLELEEKLRKYKDKPIVNGKRHVSVGESTSFKKDSFVKSHKEIDKDLTKEVEKRDGIGSDDFKQNRKSIEIYSRIDYNIYYGKVEQFNVQTRHEKLIHSEDEGSSNRENSGEIRTENKNASNYQFPLWKNLNRFITWAAAAASYSHEMSSPQNYLHSLSKKLTK